MDLSDDAQIYDDISDLVLDDDDAMEIPEVDSFVCPEQMSRPQPKKNVVDNFARAESEDGRYLNVNVISVSGLQDVDIVEELMKERNNQPLSSLYSVTSDSQETPSLLEKFTAIANDPSSYSRVVALKGKSARQLVPKERTISRLVSSPGRVAQTKEFLERQVPASEVFKKSVLPVSGIGAGSPSGGAVFSPRAVSESQLKIDNSRADGSRLLSSSRSSARSASPALENVDSLESRVLFSPSKTEVGAYKQDAPAAFPREDITAEATGNLRPTDDASMVYRRALHPPPKAEAIVSYQESTNSVRNNIDTTSTIVSCAEVRRMDRKWISKISGIVTEWPQSITLHYTDGTDSTYTTADFMEETEIPAIHFQLHQEEYIAAVRYKHKCAALNQRILGSGIEFETSFERIFTLAGNADAFFSWDAATDKIEWKAPPKQCIVGLCLGKDWEFSEDGKLEQRAVEWSSNEQAVVLDVIGVISAPLQQPTSGWNVDRLLAKSAVLKIQLRGENLAVMDWDETREWIKPSTEPTFAKGAFVATEYGNEIREGPAPVVEIRKGEGMVWTRLEHNGCWQCGPYVAPVAMRYRGWTQEHVGEEVEQDISLIVRSNIPKLGPWRRVGQKTMGVRVIWMGMRIPLYTLCELEDKSSKGKRILLDVRDGSRLLGYLASSVDEILDSSFKRVPLQLSPPPTPADVFRLVLALRIETRALPKGTHVVISCSVGRRQRNGHLVEICRSEWARNAKMQRFVGCGENSWWQGDSGIARFEMFGADLDGPAKINLGDTGTPLELEISVRRVHGTISPMPQTDYYGEVEATIDQLLGLGSTDRPVDGESRNTFKIVHERSKVACITITAAPSNPNLGEISVLAAYLRSERTRSHPETDAGQLFVDRAVICNSDGDVVFNASKESLSTVQDISHIESSAHLCDRSDEDLECGPADGWKSTFGDVNIAAKSVSEACYENLQVMDVSQSRKGSRIMSYLRERRNSGLSILGSLLRGSIGGTPRQSLSASASPMGSPLAGWARARRTAPSSPAGSPLPGIRSIWSDTNNGASTGSSPVAAIGRNAPGVSLTGARGNAPSNRRSSTSAVKFY